MMASTSSNFYGSIGQQTPQDAPQCNDFWERYSRNQVHSRANYSTDLRGQRILKSRNVQRGSPRLWEVYERPVWAKKNSLKQGAPVKSDIGLRMMQKMGWKPGEGLGKDNNGPLEPLLLDTKMDRKGLRTTADSNNRAILQNGKNPVSIVMEYCQKNRISIPDFIYSESSNTSNGKTFLCKTTFNNACYEPSQPSASKKAAKVETCKLLVNILGLNTSSASAGNWDKC
ncbi:g-patch domain-containing protein [Ditylenchus destructor]|uniref:G-patch domain-containing protein n=1 Tax=Ditylenchus destructor TaxID=166010 RepID=A0AAD4R6Y1_9BILA|nr:g-patch domain-containing protein [Ditylenchus destructor]